MCISLKQQHTTCKFHYPLFMKHKIKSICIGKSKSYHLFHKSPIIPQTLFGSHVALLICINNCDNNWTKIECMQLKNNKVFSPKKIAIFLYSFNSVFYFLAVNQRLSLFFIYHLVLLHNALRNKTNPLSILALMSHLLSGVKSFLLLN